MIFAGWERSLVLMFLKVYDAMEQVFHIKDKWIIFIAFLGIVM